MSGMALLRKLAGISSQMPWSLERAAASFLLSPQPSALQLHQQFNRELSSYSKTSGRCVGAVLGQAESTCKSKNFPFPHTDPNLNPGRCWAPSRAQPRMRAKLNCTTAWYVQRAGTHARARARTRAHTHTHKHTHTHIHTYKHTYKHTTNNMFRSASP